MEKFWRIIIDDYCDGFYNMAKDQTLLDFYFQRKTPTLRVYFWSQPFISLGYSQKVNETLDFKECAKRKVNFVRRITGGKAILHHQELTYSLVCDSNDLGLSKEVKSSYKILNSFIINFYKELGLKAYFAQDVLSSGLARVSNFCYSCCEHFDILVEGKKIGGNAQRRSKSIIFQHGSIPQKLDFEAILGLIQCRDHTLREKTTDLDTLLNRATDLFRLRGIFINSFIHTFGINYMKSNLDKEENNYVVNLINSKYLTKRWNLKNEAYLAE